MPLYRARVRLKNGKVVNTIVKVDKTKDVKRYLKKNKNIGFFKRVYYVFKFRCRKFLEFFKKSK